ncbi:hypothetical protein PSAC2689_50396 [Paraburkholderia sacchari]
MRFDFMRVLSHEHDNTFEKVSKCAYYEVSRPGELHPESLAEPNVNLSTHSAPVIQPIPRRHASGQTTRGGRTSPCVAIAHYVACAATAACTFSEPTA